MTAITIDDHASYRIICATLVAGMVDEAVGAVRIDEREPRLWYGSRLCVDQSYRRLTEMSSSASVRSHQPVYRGFGAIGAGLIYKAVSRPQTSSAVTSSSPTCRNRTPSSSSACTGNGSASVSFTAARMSTCRPNCRIIRLR